MKKFFAIVTFFALMATPMRAGTTVTATEVAVTHSEESASSKKSSEFQGHARTRPMSELEEITEKETQSSTLIGHGTTRPMSELENAEEESRADSNTGSLAISEDFQKEINENEYVEWLIEDLKEGPDIYPAYPDLPLFTHLYGGFDLEDVDGARLLSKYQAVINMYNTINKYGIELEMTSDITNNHYLGIDIQSTNHKLIEKPVLYIGQLAHVRPGSIYWEGSTGFGSGKSETVKEMNPYIPIDMIVKVDRVAYLDENGIILSTSNTFCEEIDIWKPRMLHIKVNGTDLGWVFPTALFRVDDGYSKPEK